MDCVSVSTWPEHEQALDDVVGLHANGLGELGHRCALRHLHHRVVQHERGVEALLDGLHLQTLAVFRLALLLALLAAPLPLVRGGGGHRGARLGEHLVALQLLGLHGHLRVAVLRRRLRHFQLRHRGHVGRGALLALPVGTPALLPARGGGGGLLRGGLGLLLRLDALLFRLYLGKERVEVRSALGAEHRRGALARGGLAALARVALAQGLFHRLLLRHLGGRLGCPRAGARLGLLALHALLFAFYLVGEALVGRGGRGGLPARLLLGRRAAFRMLLRRAARALGAFGLALGAFLLHRLAPRALLLGLAGLGLALLGGELGRLLVLQLAGALLDLGFQVLADLGDVGVGKHARMAFRRDLHLAQAVEQLLARHVEFLRQLMYTHAGHTPLLNLPSHNARRLRSISPAIRS